MFESVFGRGYDTQTFRNACAACVSLGLLNAGIAVKREYSVQTGAFKGKGITTSAANMVNWLKTYFGTPDVTVENPISFDAVAEKIGSRKGIYAMLPKSAAQFGASGHVTLWHNRNAIGSNHYATLAKAVYFWELKR